MSSITTSLTPIEARWRRPRLEGLSYWVLNLVAFFAAELLDSRTYVGDETTRIVLAALLAYVTLAIAAWFGWRLGARVLGIPRPMLRRLEPWLAFAPGAVLLAPKLRIAAAGRSLETLGLLLLAVGGGLLLRVWRRPSDDAERDGTRTVYGWLCLGIWAFAVPIAGLAAAVDGSPTAAGLFAGYDRVAALFAGVASLLWAVWVTRAARSPGRGLARPLGNAALAMTLAAVAMLSRPTDPPLGAAGTARSARAPAPAGWPSVIIITMDTTRADHLSVSGYRRDTTPALVDLARDSVVHANAFAPSSWTLPSHASLFTGLMPSRHHADRGRESAAADGRVRTRPLGREHLTLAEWLRSNGYHTGAVAANFAYLSRAFGLDQGFEFHDVRPNSGTAFVFLDMVDRRLVTLPGLHRALLPYRSARAINDRALGWVESLQNEPFLLFMNYMEPHTPNVPGLHYREFARDDVGARLADTPANRATVDLYDSEIASMDAELGRFLDGLRRLGLYDRSLIIVTADHGESLGEHGVWGHGYSLNEPEVRIPLIVKYPGSSWRGRRRRPVSLIDVVPTISREIGIAFPEPVDGRHLLARHPFVMTELRGAVGSATKPGPTPDVQGVALYDQGRKLLWSSDGRWRVYDLATDPEELHDVAALHRRWSRDRIDSLIERRVRH